MIVARRIKISGQGFTLLELLVVAVLISIMLAVTIPNVQGLFFNDPLKRSARLVAFAMTEARGQAAGSEHGVAMLVNVAQGRLMIVPQLEGHGKPVDEPADPYRLDLPDQVSIASIWTRASGRVFNGTTSIFVNRRGMIEPVIINLSDSKRSMGVTGAPFFNDIEISDHEVSPSAPLFARSEPIR